MEMHVPVMFEAVLGMCYVYIMQCKVEHLVYLERARVWHACTNHCMPQSWGTHCMQQQNPWRKCPDPLLSIAWCVRTNGTV